MTILDALNSLPPALLRAAGGMIVRTIDDDPHHAELSIDIALMVPGGVGTPVGYEVSVATDDLPPGIGVSMFGRYPTQVRIIDATEPIPDQLRAVDAAGIVGTLDVARMDADAPTYPHWHVKTHAGSDTERLLWLRSIPSGLAEHPRGRRLLSTDEVASQLGVTRSYVVKLAKRLRVGAQVGRDWQFTDLDVAALRQRRTTPGPEPHR